MRNILIMAASVLVSFLIGALLATIEFSDPHITINPDTVIQASTAFIALLALGLTMWQARSIRTHNMLSIKPHLCLDTKKDLSQGDFVINLLNNGLGPAFIHQVKLFINDDEILESSGIEFDILMKNLFPDYLNSYNRSSIDKDTVLPRDSSQELLKIRIPLTSQAFSEFLSAKFEENSVRLEIEYKSIYDKSYFIKKTIN